MLVRTPDNQHGLCVIAITEQHARGHGCFFRVHFATVICMSVAEICLGEIQEPFILEQKCW